MWRSVSGSGWGAPGILVQDDRYFGNVKLASLQASIPVHTHTSQIGLAPWGGGSGHLLEGTDNLFLKVRSVAASLMWVQTWTETTLLLSWMAMRIKYNTRLWSSSGPRALPPPHTMHEWGFALYLYNESWHCYALPELSFRRKPFNLSPSCDSLKKTTQHQRQSILIWTVKCWLATSWFLYICIDTYIYKHLHLRIRIHMSISMSINTNTHINIHIYADTHTHTKHMHIHKHIHIHAHTHT